MTTLHRNGQWKIQVFGREHGMPHFHVWTADGAAVLAIDSLAVLSGSIDASALTGAREWARAHGVEIAAEWRKLNPEKRR